MDFRRDGSFFTRLIAPMRDQLRRIASSTQKEYEVDDLISEAWLIADEICTEKGAPIEPEDEGLQAAVLAKIRKLFGRFVNRKMRYAVRLDQEIVDGEGDASMNPVAAGLSAAETFEPETALEHVQDEALRAKVLRDQFSEAVAYLRTFDNFSGNKQAVAQYFAIGASVLDARVKRAAGVAARQPSIFDGVETIPVDFVPLPGTPSSRRKSRRPFRALCKMMLPWQTHLFAVHGSVFAIGRHSS